MRRGFSLYTSHLLICFVKTYLNKSNNSQFLESKIHCIKFIDKKLTPTHMSEKETKEIQKYDHSEFGEVDIQPIPRIKKIARKYLVKSWTEIPHVTQHDEVDITEMEQFRNSLRDIHTGKIVKTTPLSFIIRALVKALIDFPIFNSFSVGKSFFE